MQGFEISYQQPSPSARTLRAPAWMGNFGALLNYTKVSRRSILQHRLCTAFVTNDL